MAAQADVVEIHAPAAVKAHAKEAVREPAKEIPDNYGDEKTKDIESDTYTVV